MVLSQFSAFKASRCLGRVKRGLVFVTDGQFVSNLGFLQGLAGSLVFCLILHSLVSNLLLFRGLLFRQLVLCLGLPFLGSYLILDLALR